MASDASFPRAAARRKISGRSGRSRRPGCRIESTRSTTPAASSTVGTVEPTLTYLDLIAIFDSSAHKLEAELQKIAGRWLGDIERRLEGREWIACADFTVADIMMACVLRGIRKTDLMESFPRIKAYYARCQARPAWQRTLGL